MWKNLVPNMEASKIIKERDAQLVFGNNVNRDFDGTVSKMGDHVTVKVKGKVKVYLLDKNGTYVANGTDYNGAKMNGNIAGSGLEIAQGGIPSASGAADSEISFAVNKIIVWNKEIGDIDQQLISEKGKIAEMRSGAAASIVDTEEQDIAKTIYAVSESNKRAIPNWTWTDELTSSNILNFLDALFEYYRNQKVPTSETVYGEVDWHFARLLAKALRTTFTPNADMAKSQINLGYGQFQISPTVNTTIGTTKHISFHTKEAISLVQPYTHVEGYRPDGGFTDCIKGFEIFDDFVALPKELIWAVPSYGE